MKTFLILLLMCASGFCEARNMVARMDEGRKVLLLDDGTWEYVNEKAFSGTLPELAVQAVGIWDSFLKHEKTKHGIHSVSLFIDYVNRTSLKVVGVESKVTIRDPFGNVLSEFTKSDPVAIGPKDRLRNNITFSWKDNPFVEGEMYDRLVMVATHKTFKIDVQVKKVVFENGTVLLDGGPSKIAKTDIPKVRN